jgi:POT family proton-dependent oligopeptide transporter
LKYNEQSEHGTVSLFHMKLIKGLNKNFTSAVMLNESMVLTIEKIEKKLDDGTFKTTSNAQVWNLKPKKPKFAGFQVNTLYDFFMIFVIMAGAASVFLFFLSKRLLVLMNGIR